MFLEKSCRFNGKNLAAKESGLIIESLALTASLD